MLPHLVIRTVSMSSGERIPLLLNGTTGFPLDLPNVHVLTEMRAGGRAFDTIKTSLSAIKRLYLSLAYLNIDIEERIQEGGFLLHGEAQVLVHTMRLNSKEFNRRANQITFRKALPRNVSSLESVRAKLPKNKANIEVKPGTLALHLIYAHRYLAWLGQRCLDRIADQSTDDYLALQSKIKSALDNIKENIPNKSIIEDAIDERLGLEKDLIALLKEVVNPLSPKNPWKGEHTKLRNALIIKLGLFLGVRRGELLILKLSDIDIQKRQITVHRRPHDKDDTRKKKPNTKTRARSLRIDAQLMLLVKEYIDYRRDVLKIKHHPFLFVAANGEPLSLDSVRLIFKQLRKSFPEFPLNLTTHLLRYTWNDLFSEQADKN
ncbi:MAG: putative site specific recombinase, partial [Burkholderia sp.]|nr:putative site specific recombinase [Burkholderia sp.]